MTMMAFENSLRRLGLSYADLHLVHWPVQWKLIETWKAMIKMLKEGKSMIIGVSNYSIDELQKTIQTSDIVPAINQVEFHSFLYQQDLVNFCNKNKIQVEAYNPLARGKRLNHPTIKKVANKYNKTPAQILIRWSLQHNLVAIPKSIQQNRILENTKVFDFEIDVENMILLDSLNEYLRTIFLD